MAFDGARARGDILMLREDSRPLPFTLWVQELEELAAWCARASSDLDDRAVRRAFHLSKIAPLMLRRMFAPRLSESEVELMLERGEVAAAAAAVTCGIGVERSCSSDARDHVVEFSDPDHGLIRYEAASAALAVIGGWATVLTDIHLAPARSDCARPQPAILGRSRLSHALP